MRHGRKFCPCVSGWEFCCWFNQDLPALARCLQSWSSQLALVRPVEVFAERMLFIGAYSRKKLLSILKINHMLSWIGALLNPWSVGFSPVLAECHGTALGNMCQGSGCVCSCLSTHQFWNRWRACLDGEEQGSEDILEVCGDKSLAYLLLIPRP